MKCEICELKADEITDRETVPYYKIVGFLHNGGFCSYISEDTAKEIEQTLSGYDDYGLLEYSYENDISVTEFMAGNTSWEFKRDILSDCPGLFTESCESNHNVYTKLTVAKVFSIKNEACSGRNGIYVTFESVTQAKAFIKRLNEYLKDKREKMKKATSMMEDASNL